MNKGRLKTDFQTTFAMFRYGLFIGVLRVDGNDGADDVCCIKKVYAVVSNYIDNGYRYFSLDIS